MRAIAAVTAVVAVAVVLRPGETAPADELCALVTERLRSNRTPDRVEFVDELPYNDTGKLLRRMVRERLAHLGDG